jgi:hypothetical protein
LIHNFKVSAFPPLLVHPAPLTGQPRHNSRPLALYSAAPRSLLTSLHSFPPTMLHFSISLGVLLLAWVYSASAATADEWRGRSIYQ